ncbi:prenylcysteine oxidase-like isoform X5 [Phacochoerus africanus]|uniref:prenylcysteine oxidase-like isoform X5 n=1 Tax=Phacochoerus africanus TaxID=41426 RepID=UPI001FDA4A40|nr:prenylcysteine oxidase-like isoform X5 [Phacochoerus africanus]
MARAARLLPALAALLAAAATGDARPSKIAVVGAGIGGSAVAHFLQQHFGPRVQIDVFEKGTVGGRLATISVNKQHYESGAASLHSLSLHMQDFVKQLGLRHRREVGGRSAIFNGESLVLEETDWYLLNLFRLWWHYGISFLRLQLWVEEVMEKFMRRAGPPQPVTRPEAHNQPPLPPREARPQVGAERPLHKGPGSVCLQDLQVPGPRLRLLGRGGAALLPGGGRLHQHEPALRGRVPAPGGRQPALHRRRRLGRPAGQLRPVGSDARLCRGHVTGRGAGQPVVSGGRQQAGLLRAAEAHQGQRDPRHGHLCEPAANRREAPVPGVVRERGGRGLRLLRHRGHRHAPAPGQRQLHHLRRLRPAHRRRPRPFPARRGLPGPRLPQLLLLRLPRPQALPLRHHPHHRLPQLLPGPGQPLSRQRLGQLPAQAAAGGRCVAGPVPTAPPPVPAQDPLPLLLLGPDGRVAGPPRPRPPRPPPALRAARPALPPQCPGVGGQLRGGDGCGRQERGPAGFQPLVPGPGQD